MSNFIIKINEDELSNYQKLIYGTTNIYYKDGDKFNLTDDNVIILDDLLILDEIE